MPVNSPDRWTLTRSDDLLVDLLHSVVGVVTEQAQVVVVAVAGVDLECFDSPIGKMAGKSLGIFFIENSS